MKHHNHVEAFKIMTYGSDDGIIEERLWNSRDGVTPFCIRSKDGTKELRHVRWNEDRFAPEHQPQIGERVFVDMTPEKARMYAERNVEMRWDDGTEYAMNHRYATKEEIIAILATSYTEHKGAPDIITVMDG